MRNLIKFVLNNRIILYLLFLVILGAGIYSLGHVPVDAIPDLGENQVIVYADWPGRTPKDVEDQVTYPLSTALQGISGVKDIRAQSGFGFSMIYVIFDDKIDYYYARTRVLEKLNYAGSSMPQGVVPTLGPDGTGLGQIFWYTVEGDNYSLQQLRSIQDWYIRYALASVQGVAEVASVGGYVKQYQIDVNPNKLFAYNIRNMEVLEAVKGGNLDVGAKVIEVNGMEYFIRGAGFIKSIEDIENIVIGSYNGVPVRIKEVATVTTGPDFRRGALDKGGREAVGGVVIMRYKENPLNIIKKVKVKIEEISKGLPEGVKIVPFYDRTGLINETLGTLSEALIVEMLITIAVILVFSLPFTMSFLISLTMPMSVMVSFILMKLLKIDVHIMSLAGIIIAIGTIVDMGIIITENIFRNMENREGHKKSLEEQKTIVENGTVEVASSVLGAISTIMVPFLAILVLEGQSAKLFHPVVFTKTFVLFGSLLTALLLLPALYYDLMIKNKGFFKRLLDKSGIKLSTIKIGAGIVIGLLLFVLGERTTVLLKLTGGINWIIIGEWLLNNTGMLLFSAAFLTGLFFLGKNAKNIIKKVIPWGLLHKWILLIPLVIFLTGMTIFVFKIQNEFRPPLDEGSFLFMPVLLPSASFTEVQEVLKKQDDIIKGFPEVESVVGKLGRIESATDPADITMIETIINLKPRREWRSGMTAQKLRDEMNDALTIPGVGNIWTQPIQNRIDMLSTGIRTPVGIKIFGADLKTIENTAYQIDGIIRTVPGYSSSYVERIVGKPYIEYQLKREELARFGLSVNEVQEVIMTAIGGDNLTMTVEGRERYPVRVRYMREYRDDIESLAKILILTPKGEKIPISRVADINIVMGPAMINSENGLLKGVIYLDLKPGTGPLNFVQTAQKLIDRNVKLPKGYYYQFAGNFEEQIKANEKLQYAIPLCLLLIFLIMYFTFKSARQTWIVFTAIPISLSGGIILLYILGLKMSIAVVVGFVALFGVAVNDGIILTTYINQIKKNHIMNSIKDIHEIIVTASLQRIRPLLMTSSTAMLALVPILWSSGRGSEIIRPMSVPTIGGLLMVIITIFIVPLLNSWFMERDLKRNVSIVKKN